MADVVLSGPADIDIGDIFESGCRHFGEARSRRYIDTLFRSAQMAAHFPAIGLLYTTVSGRRLRRYPSGSHVIFYEPLADGIMIIRILHCRMNFDDHLT